MITDALLSELLEAWDEAIAWDDKRLGKAITTLRAELELHKGTPNEIPALELAEPGGPPLEHAYWEFDARHKGYAKWRTMPQSERDAFKDAVADLLAPYRFLLSCMWWREGDEKGTGYWQTKLFKRRPGDSLEEIIERATRDQPTKG